MVSLYASTSTTTRRRARRAPVRRRRRAYARPVRRATARRAPSKRFRSTRRVAPARTLTKYELANLNPFDQRVNGVKIPDSNTQPSETTFDENRITTTIGASGFAEVTAFLPNPTVNSVKGVGATATTWTWPAGYGGATASGNLASLKADFMGIRPAGHGVRISCPLAPLSVTGFCHVAIVPVETYSQTTWQFPTSVTQMLNLPWYKRYTLASLTQRSITVVNKFLDATATRYFDVDSTLVATSGNVDFHFSGSWCAIIVAVEGAPVSTNPLTQDTIVHYEGLPTIGSTNNSTPAAQYNVNELEDVSRIATNHPGTFEEGQEDDLISSAMRELFGVFVPSGTFHGPMGGIQGVNTPRLTQQ